MKNVIFIFLSLLLLNSCGKKQEEASTISESEIQISMPKDMTTLYAYQKDSLSEECESENEIVCAIAQIVKCALNPKLSICDSKIMPEFLFYDDSIFAEDNVEGRPTEQSFKLLKYKPINNHTVEIYTEGTCDHNWFGACQGNVIYVMSNDFGKWLVDDIYAVEKIK